MENIRHFQSDFIRRILRTDDPLDNLDEINLQNFLTEAVELMV